MTNDIVWIDIVERKQSVLFASFITKENNHEYCLRAGIDYAMNDYKYIDDRVSFSARDMNSLFELFQERLHKEESFLQTFAEACYERCNSLVEKAREIGQLPNLMKLDREQLSYLFEEYAEEAFKLLPYLYSANVIEMLLHQEISSHLKNLTSAESEIDKYLSILIIPSKENAIVGEMNNILRIGVIIQQSSVLSTLFTDSPGEIARRLPEEDEASYRLLEDHIKEYGWLNLHSGYLGEPMSIKEVILRVKALTRKDLSYEIKRREVASLTRENAFKELISQLQIDGKMLETIKAARDFIDVRMERINAYFIAHFKVRNLMNALASNLDISYEDLLFLTYEEILTNIRGQSKPNLHEIEQRKKAYALIMINGERAIYTGEELERIRPEKPQEEYTKISSIEGTSACLGEVVAKAKVLFDINDVDKVEDGEIVISPMTTPDLMPALEKASGIVTDEGGILCHAAIVSRELGIPCIIGTKLATRIIRDGDEISLIATDQKGVIRLIGRE